MIGRIITSEVNRAAREKAARNKAAADRAVRAVQARTPTRPLYPTPPPPVRPASPPRRSSGTGMAILGVVCFAGIIAAIVIPLVRHHNQQAASLANQQTCSGVWNWAPGYDPGLPDEIGPASLTPDPQLRGDVARLLADVQDAPVVSAAVVPTPQIKADLSAVSARCNVLGLNPGGNDGNAIP